MAATLNEVKKDIVRHVLLTEIRAARERGIPIDVPDEDFTEVFNKVTDMIDATPNIDVRVWMTVLSTVAVALESA